MVFTSLVEMVLNHYRADHVHVADAANDGQANHDQQSGYPAPFHAQSDRRNGVAVHQRSVVSYCRAHYRLDDGRGRLVVRARHVEVVQHGVLRDKHT